MRMLVVEMLRQRFGRDVTQGRPLFEGGRYLAEAIGPDDARWRKAMALLRDSAGDGDEVLAVYGEAFHDGQAFVAGRAGRDWIVVGTAECR
jgi:hypothetical protein